MCCYFGARFYKARIVLVAFLACCEAILGVIRALVYFAPGLLSIGSSNSTYQLAIDDSITIIFLFDMCSAFVGILVGLCVLLALALTPILYCVSCCWSVLRTDSMRHTRNMFKACFDLKAARRFVTLNCNCPCYRARPALRFGLRVNFLLVCLVLRLTATYLYYWLEDFNSRITFNFYCCAISLPFLIIMLILDIYHWIIWWHYSPSTDPNWFGRSKKHIRYIPYHLTGKNRRPDILGDHPCTSKPCYNPSLSHAAIFHKNDFKPHPRWSEMPNRNRQTTYIGFHTTNPEAATLIVHSQFKPSKGGMLGKGVYFARSIADTIGKAQGGSGACFIAEIQMGKVFEVDKNAVYNSNRGSIDHDLKSFVQQSKWHSKYDTCYLNHPDKSKDEFCVKDPEKQIKKWIVVIDEPHDSKVKEYGLDIEFDSTTCSCI